MPPSDGGPTRSTPVWLLALAGLLLAARIGVGSWEATHPEDRPELVTWTAPAAAVDAARARGRLVLYAFTDRRAAASRALSAALFADPEVAVRLERQYVAVRIEGGPGEDTAETAALRARFKVTELPALVVATPDGARSRRVAGKQGSRATLEALARAHAEVLELPFNRGGFHFQVGGTGRDSGAARGTR